MHPFGLINDVKHIRDIKIRTDWSPILRVFENRITEEDIWA